MTINLARIDACRIVGAEKHPDPACHVEAEKHADLACHAEAEKRADPACHAETENHADPACPMAVNRSELANPAETKCSLTFELIDERGALERVMLHFSHLEKETKRLDEKRYQVTIRYDRGDETEILIRILSFGPNVRVTAPEEFIEKIRERLLKQLEWQNKKVADEK